MLQFDAMTSPNPIADACAHVGGAASLARAVQVTPPMVTQWLRGIRSVSPDRCPQIERATAGAVPCETLRPDVRWSRIPDSGWPHPAGRPVIDVARPALAGQEVA